MPFRVKAIAGQHRSALLRLNEIEVGALDAPQLVDVTVGVELYCRGKGDRELLVPMCSSHVQRCHLRRYDGHVDFDEEGEFGFVEDRLPFPEQYLRDGMHGIYRACGLVRRIRFAEGAEFVPLAAAFLPTIGLNFHPGQFEHGPGCVEAAEAYCQRHGDTLLAAPAMLDFLTLDGRFNGDLDSLLYWRGEPIGTLPRSVRMDDGSVLDLATTSVAGWYPLLSGA